MVSETGTQILGIFIGFLAYIMLYLGKGIQKYAIEGFKDKTETEQTKTGKATKNTAVWIIGTILTTSFMIIQWLPLSGIFDNISPNRIAPLEGFGLIVLLIFSYYVLKEEISKIQVIGAGVIIVGLILINIPTPTDSGIVNYTWFWILLGIIIGIEIVAILVIQLILKKNRITGMIIALFSGTCMAYQTISKGISGLNIWIVIVLFFALATLVTTQWAFTKINANLVVPIFTSTSIILTAILSVVILGEQLVVIQIIGMLVIVGGIVLVSAFEKPVNLKEGIEIKQ